MRFDKLKGLESLQMLRSDEITGKLLIHLILVNKSEDALGILIRRNPKMDTLAFSVY